MGFGAKRHRRVISLLAAGFLMTASTAEAASVPVRAANHKDHGRLVFDWPQKVEFTARVEGERLIVAFNQPIETTLDKVVAVLSPYLSTGRMGADGKSVEFTLKRPVTLRSFRNGNGVALDITPSESADSPAAPPPTQGVTPANPATTQAGAATVKLKANDQPTLSRVAFAWSAPVTYTMQRDGSAVTIQFDKAARADLSPASKLRNISGMEQFRSTTGGLAVTFVAPIDADIHEARDGNAVIIEVLNPGTRKAASAAPSPAAPATPASTSPVPAAPGATAPAATPAPVLGLAPTPPPTPAAPPPPVPAPPSPALAARAPTPTPTPVPASPSALTAPAVESSKPSERGPILTFDTGGPAAAAIYPRAGYLYIVFDKPVPIGAGTVSGPGADQIGAIEPVPATGGSAFRTRIGPYAWPQVERQGTVWRIIPTTVLTTPSIQDLRIDTDPDFMLGARLMVRTLDAVSIVQLADPEVGDRLHIVPLPRPGQAINELRHYPDLEVLSSFQGVAIRPISDSLTVRPVKEGVEVTAAGGLHLSPMEDTNKAQPPVPQGGASARLTPPTEAAPAPVAVNNKRLFDLDAWQRGGVEKYTVNRQALQQAIVDVPESERGRGQLDLARFYFANGLGPETQGMLDVVQMAQPDLEGWSEFKALRGAARVQAGDMEGAAADLGYPALASNPEAGLWRAFIAAQRGDWPAAARGFKTGASILNKYPEPLLSALTVPAIEAALQTNDTTEAKRLLDRMEAHGISDEDHADLHFLRGELLRRTGDSPHAHEELNKAFNSLDRYYRVKAGLALVNLDLEEGKASPAAAAETLAGLTFTWRGDDLEVALRQRLGEMQLAAGQYAEGFTTMKETAALLGEDPHGEKITKDMGKTFANLYKDGAAGMPALEALKLYDQFRELTPVGPAGDEVIRQLAERLIQIDLLGRAAELLQYQMEYRLSGVDKAYVGTRLAMVQLLDNKPELALKALEMSNVPEIPPELMAERRLMQGKALDQMGRGNDALLLLAQDDSKEANLLRVDLAWRAQNWTQAEVALNKVIGPPPLPNQPIEPERSPLVLNRAVALALAGDSTGLSQLRSEFGGAMDKGADADAFRVLTRPEQSAGQIDANSIRSRVAEVDVFKKFLKNYKGRQPESKAKN